MDQNIKNPNTITPQQTQMATIKKSWPKLIIFSIIAAFLLINGGAFFKTYKSNRSLKRISPGTMTAIVSAAVKNAPDISPFLMDNLPFGETYNNVWWISDDGWNILVENTHHVTIRIPASSIPNNIEPVQTNLSIKFQEIIASIMKKHGLLINDKNSSTSTADKRYYDYVLAYEGAGLLCTALTNADRFSDISTDDKMVIEMKLTCADSDRFKDVYEQQLPFLKGLNEKNSVISRLEVKNNVARMQIRGRRTGANAFMYKSGPEWKKIIVSQQAPQCSEFVKNNVPTEFWPGCYDKNNNFKEASPAWK